MEYTVRWNNFQFRDMTYLDGHTEEGKFDLVKWKSHEPLKVTDGKTGEEKIISENCYSVGTLIWDDKEKYFKFNSCGLRFLEEYTEGLNEWILAFAGMKEIELKYKDE